MRGAAGPTKIIHPDWRPRPPCHSKAAIRSCRKLPAGFPAREGAPMQPRPATSSFESSFVMQTSGPAFCLLLLLTFPPARQYHGILSTACFHHRSRLYDNLPSWCPSLIRAAKPRVLPAYHNGREMNHPPLARRCFSRPCPLLTLPGTQSPRAALPRWLARNPRSSERCPVSPCPGHRSQPRCSPCLVKGRPSS